MYRIVKNNLPQLVTDFELIYYQKAKTLIEGYLNGKELWHIKDEDKDIEVKVAATPGSYVREFLEKCVGPENKLHELLVGDFSSQLSIITEVRQDNVINLKSRITKTKYPILKRLKAGDHIVLADFNTILHDIFIDGMFDAEDGDPNKIDKTAFVKALNLEWCPYCGLNRILPIDMATGAVVKPQIDHFLPKSRYPFLAMNFFNLIPSCTVCNESPNKHSKDPLGEDGTHYHLMQPYMFNKDAFEFEYECDPLDYLDEKKYKVKIDYKNNQDLKYGLTRIIYLESLYASMTKDVANIFYNLHTESEAAISNYTDIGIRNDFWQTRDPRWFFRNIWFTDNNAMYIQSYKFLSDIYRKMHEYFEKQIKH